MEKKEKNKAKKIRGAQDEKKDDCGCGCLPLNKNKKNG